MMKLTYIIIDFSIVKNKNGKAPAPMMIESFLWWRSGWSEHTYII